MDVRGIVVRFPARGIFSPMQSIQTHYLNGMGRSFTSTVKNIFESKPVGSRRRGRPRIRWLVFVERDLRELKIKKWRQKAVDREDWDTVIKVAKATEGRRAENK